MVFNLPDASVFAESVNFYSAEFEDILAKVVLCYRMMINGESRFRTMKKK